MEWVILLQCDKLRITLLLVQETRKKKENHLAYLFKSLHNIVRILLLTCVYLVKVCFVFIFFFNFLTWSVLFVLICEATRNFG